MHDSRFLPDKHAIRRAFERAVHTYDGAAVLQREVAERMFTRLEYVKVRPERILDLGCGTGHGTRLLAERYQQASIIAVDHVEAMLRFNRDSAPWWKRRLPLLNRKSPRFVCADMEALPLAPNRIGLVWSNQALHWGDMQQCVAEAHRVLETGGLFMFSTLGPDTLKELRAAFTSVDGYEHVNRFIDMHDIGDTLVHAGFADPVMDMEIITVTFDNVDGLTRDLKSLGGGTHLEGRRQGLMAPSCWREVSRRYEAMRRDGKLPVTAEVIYGHAWKPQARASADGRQIVQFRDYPRGDR